MLEENSPLPVEAHNGGAPKRTFFDLVEALARSDDDLADPDFDPILLIGDLRNKVDAIQSVLNRMEAVATFLEGLAKPILAKASAIKNNRQRLRNYVSETMTLQKLERIPGNTFKVELRQSPPALKTLREPNAPDYERWPLYCKIERRYVWDKEKIKADMLAGILKPEAGFPALITQGFWPDFKVNIPEELESKKKKGKKNAIEATRNP